MNIYTFKRDYNFARFCAVLAALPAIALTATFVLLLGWAAGLVGAILPAFILGVAGYSWYYKKTSRIRAYNGLIALGFTEV